ncbi:MAG: hypothetical protein WAV40_02830 [Microgenomates group bacterium]
MIADIGPVVKQIVGDTNGVNSRAEIVRPVDIAKLVEDLRTGEPTADSIAQTHELVEEMQEAAQASRPETEQLMQYLAENKGQYLSHAVELPEWMSNMPIETLELFFKLMEAAAHEVAEETKRR